MFGISSGKSVITHADIQRSPNILHGSAKLGVKVKCLTLCLFRRYVTDMKETFLDRDFKSRSDGTIWSKDLILDPFKGPR